MSRDTRRMSRMPCPTGFFVVGSARSVGGGSTRNPASVKGFRGVW
jgi:hypothetical protein